ncbi:RHS repeat protein, partial [Citrobacter werkmanii]|nr:RHS repeat protein [Citrobacter werkmanii]
VHWSDTRMELSARPYETWYGWEGDRLTTVQTQQNRIQTVYAPGSFTPLVRIETDTAEQAKARHRSLAEKLEQEGSEDGQGVKLPAALKVMLDRLEGELRRNAVSEESRQWLAGCGLTVEQMAGQLEPHHEPERKVHLYHCDQRGLPLALVSIGGKIEWSAEYDAWGNVLCENNPHNTKQLIRLPGQQYDEETGLYYNRHRYYDPSQGRYITQDPTGLKGGWHSYIYPLEPINNIDPLGLKTCVLVTKGSMSLLPGFRDHASLFIERAYIENGQYVSAIYDPSGSYARSVDLGNADILSHDDASFDRYKDFYKKHDNSTVDITCNYETTTEAEMNFYNKAIELGSMTGPVCASTVSTVLDGSPFFPRVTRGTFFPGNLFRDAGIDYSKFGKE